jgi:hypothetical protein
MGNDHAPSYPKKVWPRHNIAHHHRISRCIRWSIKRKLKIWFLTPEI